MMGFVTSQDMQEQFLNEAKRLLEEEVGKAKLATAQALYLMYLTLGCLGKDRMGLIFRFMAFETMKRLRLEEVFWRLHDNGKVSSQILAEKRSISQTLWGLFILEV
jgi:hypothetical protein